MSTPIAPVVTKASTVKHYDKPSKKPQYRALNVAYYGVGAGPDHNTTQIVKFSLRFNRTLTEFNTEVEREAKAAILCALMLYHEELAQVYSVELYRFKTGIEIKIKRADEAWKSLGQFNLPQKVTTKATK